MPSRTRYLKALEEARAKGIEVVPPEPPTLPNGDTDWWRVIRLVTAPLARNYLRQCALNPFGTMRENLEAAGSTQKTDHDKTVQSWQYLYAGFAALEEELRTRPDFAAYFVSSQDLPKIMALAAEIAADPTAPKNHRFDAIKAVISVATLPRARDRRRVTRKDVAVGQEQAEEMPSMLHEMRKKYGLGDGK